MGCADFLDERLCVKNEHYVCITHAIEVDGKAGVQSGAVLPGVLTMGAACGCGKGAGMAQLER